MKSIPLIIGIAFLGMFVAIVIAVYYGKQYRYNSFVQTIKETAEVCITSELNKSSRVDMSKKHVVKPDFEEQFKELFLQNISTKVEIKDFEFDYLEEEDGNLKAVYISVTDDHDNVYQTVFATELNNENLADRR